MTPVKLTMIWHWGAGGIVIVMGLIVVVLGWKKLRELGGTSEGERDAGKGAKPKSQFTSETSQKVEEKFSSKEGSHPLMIALALLIAGTCIALAIYEFSRLLLFPVPDHSRPLSRHSVLAAPPPRVGGRVFFGGAFASHPVGFQSRCCLHSVKTAHPEFVGVGTVLRMIALREVGMDDTGCLTCTEEPRCYDGRQNE